MSDAVSRKLEIQIESLNKDIVNLTEIKKQQTFQYHNDIQRLRQDKTALTDAVFVLKEEFAKLLEKKQTISEDIKLFQESHIAKIKQDIEIEKKKAQQIIDKAGVLNKEFQEKTQDIEKRERKLRVGRFELEHWEKRLEKQERQVIEQIKQLDEKIEEKQIKLNQANEELKNLDDLVKSLIKQKHETTEEIKKSQEKYRQLTLNYVKQDEELATKAQKLATIELEQKEKEKQLEIKARQIKDRQATLDRAFKELRSKYGK